MDPPNRNHLGVNFERGFRLEELGIDPATGEVAGPGGHQKLDPKVMDVLVLLAARAGQVVSRDEMHEQLWPSSVVTDDALTRCIHELRRQLSLAGGNERYRTLIETLPKRGYQLKGTVASLEPRGPVALPPPARRKWLAAGAAAALLALILFLPLRGEDPVTPPVSPANSIAVLPFTDMSEAQDQAYFADGMAEEILNRLTRSGGLRVIARTSSFAFRDRAADIREIAEALGVSHVLEGSVRRSGDHVRITAQLISAADNSHAWSETYDRDMGELLGVQDEIAEAVATALRVTLTGVSPESSVPVKPEAYELFLQGRFFYNRRAPGDIERAAQLFRDSLARDPSFPRAWAALAGAYALQVSEDADAQDKLGPLQGEAAKKAVELGPGLAVAHARLAQYYYQVGERSKGEEHTARAKALDPEDPLVMGFSSDDAVWSGDFDGAVETWRRLVERDPLSPTDRLNYADFLMRAGKAEHSTLQIRKALEFNPELEWGARLDLLRSLVLQRRYAEAEVEVPRLPDGLPRDHGLAFLHQAPGRQKDADDALERLVRAGEEADHVMVAEAFALRGRTNDAFAALAAVMRATESARLPSHTLRPRRYWLRTEMLMSPFLTPLHSDPRWNALMTEPQ